MTPVQMYQGIGAEVGATVGACGPKRKESGAADDIMELRTNRFERKPCS